MRRPASCAQLVRNPLIIATALGPGGQPARACASRPGWSRRVTRIGAASLALGLMAAGAGMQFGAPGAAARCWRCRCSRSGTCAAAGGLAGWRWLFRLDAAQAAVLLAFSALPTASSAYVLAARMGYNGAVRGGAGDAVDAAGHGEPAVRAGRAALSVRAASRSVALRVRCASAHATCSRTSALGMRRARSQARCAQCAASSLLRAQAHCPAPPRCCAASARGRCGGSGCLRCGAGTPPRSSANSVDQLAARQALARVEIGQRRCAARTCSRGRPAGSRRSRRCGCRSAAAAPAGSAPACSIVR